MIALITESQERLLEALATYKFLSTSQLIRLKVCKERSGVYKAVRGLSEGKKPLVGKLQLGLVGRLQKAENLHYLTKQGADLVASHFHWPLETVKHPASESFFYRDYFHRKATIDLHIAFRAWCRQHQHEVQIFETYFDGDKAKIALPEGHLIADALAVIHSSESQIKVFEVYMGSDVKRTLKQLKQHAEALALGELVERMGLRRSYQVHCLFEKLSCLQSVLKRAHADPELAPFRRHFLLKPLSELETGFGGAWVNLAGEVVGL